MKPSGPASAPPRGATPAGRPPLTGYAANTGAGFNDTIANTFGFPVDATTGVLNAGIRGVDRLTGAGVSQISNPVGGSDSIRSLMGAIGADPRNVAPADQTQQAARSMAGAGLSAVMPMGAARALPELAGLPGAVQRAFGNGGITGTAAAGAVGGLTGQIASNAAPPQWKSLADAGGNFIGGGVGALSVASGKALIDAGGSAFGNFLGPMIGRVKPVMDASGAPAAVPDANGNLFPVKARAGQLTMAGRKLVNAATNPAAVQGQLSDVAQADAQAQPFLTTLADPAATDADRQAAQQQLSNIPGRSQVVPGSAPTLPELVDDAGISNLGRAVSAKNPAPFLLRRGQQNTANVQQLAAQGPASAEPEDVGTFFRQQLSNMDAQAQAEHDQLLGTAQKQTAAIGSPVPAGGDQQNSALQQFGAPIRSSLQAADDAAKMRTSALFNAVDPDNSLTVPMRAVSQGANDILAARPKNAGPLAPTTQAIFGTAQLQPAQQSFGELAALRSRITDQLRATRINPELADDNRMLTQLLSRVDDTLSNGVEGKAAQEADAVQSGQMSPEETMFGQWANDRRQWYDGRSAQPSRSISGGFNGEVSGGNAGTRPAAVSGPYGAKGQARGGPGNVAGNQSLPDGSQPLTPWDQAAATRYAAARASHAERKATFANAPGVGSALKSGPTWGSYNMADSSVPAAIFTSGKQAAERIQAYRRAGGDMKAVADYAAFDLRRSAEREDGTLDPKKYQTWIANHSEVMTAFPDLSRKFATAAKARQALDAAAAAQAQTRSVYEKSAAGRFLGAGDPVSIVGAILNKPQTAQSTMQQLVRQTAGDKVARAGLQRSIVEYILRDLRGETVAPGTDEREINAGRFQKFIRQTGPALREVFSSPQMKAIEDVSRDIQRTQEFLKNSKLPHGSNTAQDVASMQTHGGHAPSGVSQIIAMELLEKSMDHMESAAHGLAGKLAGLKIAALFAVPITAARRAAGLKKVDDLLTLAMLHPQLANALMRRVPNQGAAQMQGSGIANLITRTAAAQAFNAAPAPVQQGQQSPGIFPGWDAAPVSAQ